MADPAPVQRMSFGEAAAAMSERLQRDGGGLQPEFETEAPAETQDAPAEEVEETAETQGESEQQEASETETSEERFEIPERVEDLAEMLGVDVGDLYGLSLGVSVGDGVERLTLGQMKDRVTEPLRDEVDRRQWLDKRQAEETQLQAQRQELEQRRTDADALAQVVLSNLTAQEQQAQQYYDGLLRNVEFQSRDGQAYQIELFRAQAAVQEAQQHKQGVVAQMQALQQQRQQEYEREIGQRKVEGLNRLRKDLLPEWREDGAFQSGAETLRSYALQERFGLKPEMVDSETSPVIWYWAEMARRYEELQAKAKEKPRPTPTSKLRPGAPQVKLPRGRRAEKEAMDRLSKSGDVRDAQAALKSRLQQL